MSPASGTNTARYGVIGIGEAMVEFASLGGDQYRRGFAGDTLNTCWHLAQLLLPEVPEQGAQSAVAYCTRIGQDAFSEQLLSFIAASGLDTAHVQRDTQRNLGLYVISLDGAERHFSYWREQSAARRLADDLQALRAAIQGRRLVHVSGITLAVIGATGRRHLMQALAEARAAGTQVSFDPNVRSRLWPDRTELRQAMLDMLAHTDIALPSFDDEAALWGDVDPAATLARLTQAGVPEVVVKNGAGVLGYIAAGRSDTLDTPAVSPVIDTTGAGDAFNAGYLAARLVGWDVPPAIRLGQTLAGIVIGHYGALAPVAALQRLRQQLARSTS